MLPAIAASVWGAKMARAIIRLSLESSEGSVRTRNRINDALVRDRGFQSIGTGTYERLGVRRALIMEALHAVLEALERPDAAAYDHLWVYLDNPPRRIP